MYCISFLITFINEYLIIVNYLLLNYLFFLMLLHFFLLGSTFVCPTEIIAFSDKANEFRDINCDVIGVSVDSHFTHLAWTNTPRKVYTLL